MAIVFNNLSVNLCDEGFDRATEQDVTLGQLHDPIMAVHSHEAGQAELHAALSGSLSPANKDELDGGPC
jgi:hypothetical protein